MNKEEARRKRGRSVQEKRPHMYRRHSAERQCTGRRTPEASRDSRRALVLHLGRESQAKDGRRRMRRRTYSYLEPTTRRCGVYSEAAGGAEVRCRPYDGEAGAQMGSEESGTRGRGKRGGESDHRRQCKTAENKRGDVAKENKLDA